MTIDLTKLDEIPPLSRGSHDPGADMCVMEAAAHIAGEPWSDHPVCVCPVLAVLLRTWNDGLPDDERDTLLRPLIPRVIGTRSTPAVETRRATMAADWFIRVNTPAWIRLAGFVKQADMLAALPEIKDFTQCPSLMPALNAVHEDCAAARATVWDAEWDAARATVWDAVWAAARAAEWDADWDAAMAAARAADWDAAMAAAWDADWAAARDADWDADWDALNATRKQLQQSALDLVHRMIEVKA